MIYSKKKNYIFKKGIGLFVFFIGILLFVFSSIQPEAALAKENQSDKGGVIHAFYPSYAVYSEQIQKYIDEVDSISFAWSRIDANEPGVLNTVKGKNGNTGFYYPEDYLKPVTYAKSKGKPLQLSIYMNGSDCIKLLPYSDQRELMINAIINALQKDITQGGNIYFDGVVIDFEGLRDTDGEKNPILYEGKQISTYFTQFLIKLKEELNVSGKKLYVAVNPRLYYDGYNYSEILDVADQVILMAHDYEPAGKLSKNQVLQYTGYNALSPIDSMAPIRMVRKALNDIRSAASDTDELSKVWLQICFDSAQWKYGVNTPKEWSTLEASCLSKEGRVTPLYKSIKARVDNSDGSAQDLLSGYNNELQTPFIQYFNTSDKTWNIILYEDISSLTAKIDQAKEYGLGGISIWSLSNVPDYNDANGQKYHLNGWSAIMNKMEAFDSLSADSRQIVSFKDTAVEQSVREKLGKLTSSITKADVKGIYRLKLVKGVKTLADLKQLQNLEYLDAGQQNLKDIKTIGSLKNLRVLYLQRNEISDISPLKKLTNLKILSLNGNRLVSIAPLSALTNLQELYLRENKIEDITPLSNLTKLNTLEIGFNKLKNLKTISRLKELWQLSMDNNEISDLKGIEKLSGLNTLDLSNNKITEIGYLKNLTGLKQLYLQRNSISDIRALSGMKKLKELSLNGNRVSDLKPFTKLASLEKLYLKDNQITGITPLKVLNNLKELYLSGNQIINYGSLKLLFSQLQGKCDFQLE